MKNCFGSQHLRNQDPEKKRTVLSRDHFLCHFSLLICTKNEDAKKMIRALISLLGLEKQKSGFMSTRAARNWGAKIIEKKQNCRKGSLITPS